MAVPWIQIVRLMPSILEVSRELLKRTRKLPAPDAPPAPRLPVRPCHPGAPRSRSGGSCMSVTRGFVGRRRNPEGRLPPGRRLLDSTSGNMGISYATFGAAMNIPVTLCVPANASSERIAILRALGAELVLTDPSAGSDGAIVEARRLAAEQPEQYWYANQYDNPANWQAHYVTTGPEILAQTNGEVTHLVVGLAHKLIPCTGRRVRGSCRCKSGLDGTETRRLSQDCALHRDCSHCRTRAWPAHDDAGDCLIMHSAPDLMVVY